MPPGCFLEAGIHSGVSLGTPHSRSRRIVHRGPGIGVSMYPLTSMSCAAVSMASLVSCAPSWIASVVSWCAVSAAIDASRSAMLCRSVSICRRMSAASLFMRSIVCDCITMRTQSAQSAIEAAMMAMMMVLVCTVPLPMESVHWENAAVYMEVTWR